MDIGLIVYLTLWYLGNYYYNSACSCLPTKLQNSCPNSDAYTHGQSLHGRRAADSPLFPRLTHVDVGLLAC